MGRYSGEEYDDGSVSENSWRALKTQHRMMEDRATKAEAERDAALARNAELEERIERRGQQHDDQFLHLTQEIGKYVTERDDARAELDNLRGTLAQKIETAVLPVDHTKTVTVVDVQRQCAALVRGSDDE